MAKDYATGGIVNKPILCSIDDGAVLFMPITLTPELVRLIQEIDRLKGEISDRPPLPESELRRLEATFIEDTVFHGMRLDAWMKERGLD